MNSRWQDTPAAVFLRLLADLMVVNLLTLICSFGVITIGASLTAMYAVLFQRQRDEGMVNATKTFFRAFAKNFWKATVLELVLALLLVVAGVDFWYAAAIAQPGKTVFTVVAVIVAFLALAVFLMAFPQQAVYSNSVKNYLKNSFTLTFCAPLALLLSAAAWAALWILAYIEPEVIVRFGVLYLLWGFAFPAYATARLLSKVFEKTKPDAQFQADPEKS